MKISTLILIALSSAFLPRIFTFIGFPPILNFIHFFVIFLLYFFSKPWENKDLQYINISMLSLCIVIFLSGAFNGTGLINISLEMLLFCEPFMLLAAVISHEWDKKSILIFKKNMSLLCFFHIALMFFQFLFLGYTGDDIQGVFLGMGAGSHVAGSVSMTFGIFWFINNRHKSFLNRSFVLILAFIIVILSDSKQIIAVCLIAFFLYYISTFLDTRKNLKNLALLSSSVAFIFFFGKKFYPPLLAWISSSKLYMGFDQKFSVIGLIADSYNSSICWLLGLGPGHTISRLAWLMDSYGNWLYPLGATTSKLTNIILYANDASWLSNSSTGSSIFSLMFSYAGIWGDTGFLGLLAYCFCLFMIYYKFCATPLDRFWLLSIFVYGIAFAWLEEPSFMLFMICLIGVSWQESKNTGDTYLPTSVTDTSIIKAADANSISS